jgi:hypothetical protein
VHTLEDPPLAQARPGRRRERLTQTSARKDRFHAGPARSRRRAATWLSPRALACHAANENPRSSEECVQPERLSIRTLHARNQTRVAHMKAEDLMIAMIERCREMILEHEDPGRELPEPLRSKHLVAMCDRLTQHVDDWTAVKLSRWIGFLQCAMIANRMIDLGGAKKMFDQAKNAFGESSRDVLDHLDPDQPFEFEIGGEG